MAEKTVLRKKDIDSLSTKLEDFAKDLPEQEQNVLGWLLARSRAASESELSEAELEAVAGGGLADALGLSPDADTISVTWSHKFNQSQ